MKRQQIYPYRILIPLLFVAIVIACSNDDDNNSATESDIKYFRIKSCPITAHGNWQDTSFIVATRNSDVIKQCRDELAKPLAERRLFPFGDIVPGNGKYNNNASLEFNWRYDEQNWKLVETSVEVNDGCPYSDVHVDNWVNTLKRYGGWGNRIAEEVTYAKGR